ncbi:MAG TPA: hypothetical protein PLX71_08330, partial [Phycicoccus sp.]|nr:hypothetical protein [Phycicoccus sp.]
MRVEGAVCRSLGTQVVLGTGVVHADGAVCRSPDTRFDDGATSGQPRRFVTPGRSSARQPSCVTGWGSSDTSDLGGGARAAYGPVSGRHTGNEGGARRVGGWGRSQVGGRRR